tara:strand:+ start:15698 stop:16294 length:597 start_codon:yes stop_codon:yes gene_type:complete
MGRGRGRPRIEKRLEDIIEVAAAHFCQRGFAEATLEDIALELGMTRPALYHYAASKEELLMKCCDWSFEQYIEKTQNLFVEKLNGKEILKKFFLIYSELVCDDVGRCFISLSARRREAANQASPGKQMRAVNSTLSQILDQGIADGSLAGCVDKKATIAALFGAFNSLPTIIKPKSKSAGAMGARLLSVFLDGLAPGQ